MAHPETRIYMGDEKILRQVFPPDKNKEIKGEDAKRIIKDADFTGMSLSNSALYFSFEMRTRDGETEEFVFADWRLQLASNRFSDKWFERFERLAEVLEKKSGKNKSPITAVLR